MAQGLNLMMRTSLKVSRTRQTDRDVRAGFPMREEYEAVRRLACVEIFSRDDPGRVDAGSTRGCGAQSIHGDEGASGACRKSCITPPVSEQDPADGPRRVGGPATARTSPNPTKVDADPGFAKSDCLVRRGCPSWGQVPGSCWLATEAKVPHFAQLLCDAPILGLRS